MLKRSFLLRILKNALMLSAFYFFLNTWQTKNLLPSDGNTKAPTFSLKTLDGNRLAVGGKKNRRTLLYFFAPWCSICNLTTDNITRLKNYFGEDTEVIAVALSYSNIQSLRTFKAENSLNIPIALGTQKVGSAFKVEAFPTFYFLDKNGFIRSKTVGYTSTIGLALRR